MRRRGQARHQLLGGSPPGDAPASRSPTPSSTIWRFRFHPQHPAAPTREVVIIMQDIHPQPQPPPCSRAAMASNSDRGPSSLRLVQHAGRSRSTEQHLSRSNAAPGRGRGRPPLALGPPDWSAGADAFVEGIQRRLSAPPVLQAPWRARARASLLAGQAIDQQRIPATASPRPYGLVSRRG